MKRQRSAYVEEQGLRSASGRDDVPQGAAGEAPYVAKAPKKRNPLSTFMHGFTTVVMVLAIVLAAALVGVRLIGYDVYTVLSGSMEPTYHTGSVIYVKPCEPEEIKVGDPITFVLNEDLVVATHRVIEIDEVEGEFWTKGDANDAPDGAPVLFENLIGKPVYTIPYLGYVADYVQNPPGTYVAVAACAFLIMLTFLPGLFAKDEGEEEEAAKKAKGKKGKNAQPSRQAQPARSAHGARQEQPVRQAQPARTAQPARAAQQVRAEQSARATQHSRQTPRVSDESARQRQAAARQRASQDALPNNPRLRMQAQQQQRAAQAARQARASAQDRNSYPLDDARRGENPRQ